MIESVVGFGCPTGMDRKRFLKPYVGKLKIEDAIKLKVLLHGKSKVIVDKNRLETMFECVERELIDCNVQVLHCGTLHGSNVNTIKKE